MPIIGAGSVCYISIFSSGFSSDIIIWNGQCGLAAVCVSIVYSLGRNENCTKVVLSSERLVQLKFAECYFIFEKSLEILAISFLQVVHQLKTIHS